MKRVGHLFEQIVPFASLLAAYQRARRGKRGRPAAERFARQLEPELFRIGQALVDGSWQPGPVVTFTVFDPKRRQISVAPFGDRVVHHAVIGAIAPVLERGMDPDSYGCRVGKGTDAALARAVGLCRRWPVCLKADVQAFFASVPHDRLLGQLARLFKDRRLLALLERIVRAGGEPGSGRGVPIGNLTSQWFANLYLTPLDRFLRAHASCTGLVRYMDDVLAFGRDRTSLRALQRDATGFLADHLGLAFKPGATQLWSTRGAGVPFLGFRVSVAGLRLRGENGRRLLRRIAARERDYRLGRLPLAELVRSTESRLAHLQRAPTRALRQVWLDRHPPLEW